MKPGDTYVAPDGTILLVVRAAHVDESTPRWWVDGREALVRVEDYDGPVNAAELHFEPRSTIRTTVMFALVMP